MVEALHRDQPDEQVFVVGDFNINGDPLIIRCPDSNRAWESLFGPVSGVGADALEGYFKTTLHDAWRDQISDAAEKGSCWWSAAGVRRVTARIATPATPSISIAVTGLARIKHGHPPASPGCGVMMPSRRLAGSSVRTVVWWRFTRAAWSGRADPSKRGETRRAAKSDAAFGAAAMWVYLDAPAEDRALSLAQAALILQADFSRASRAVE